MANSDVKFLIDRASGQRRSLHLAASGLSQKVFFQQNFSTSSFAVRPPRILTFSATSCYILLLDKMNMLNSMRKCNDLFEDFL